MTRLLGLSGVFGSTALASSRSVHDSAMGNREFAILGYECLMALLSGLIKYSTSDTHRVLI